ncbi:C40 family peptidase [Flavobacterium sp.]|uniref:C40 family peptidase n=1 Tax=Flavobacterium sp. TaxID=239 RepID=UPI003750FEB8
MKQISYIILLFILVTSCKPTSSTIITSKKEAIKKNKYDTNLPSKVATTDKKIKTEKIETSKKASKRNSVNNDNDSDIISSSANVPYLCEQLVNNASDNIGSPYRTGGLTKAGFDCSGLIYSTYKNFNISLPRTSTEMSRYGRVLNRGEIRKGDLIFFKTNGRNQINHVGLVVDVNDGEIKFVHSSIHGGVIISSTKEDYYRKAFAQVNRVVE